ncbi:MAG TPA: transposase, partial [bacterium]
MIPFKRRSIRLKPYDYSQTGLYFITICTHGSECFLGEIKNSKVVLNESGWMVTKTWSELPKRFSFVRLDSFIVMPNHFHGILAFDAHKAESSISPDKKLSGTADGSLPRVIQAFKSLSSKQFVQIRKQIPLPFSKLWHRNYYEHVIKHHVSLANIRKYITENLLKWEVDEHHPENVNKIRANSKFAP